MQNDCTFYRLCHKNTSLDNIHQWYSIQFFKWHLTNLHYLLSIAVAEVKLKDSQYTLDHVRAFGMYNYLHIDPWYEDSVFFVDCKGRLLNLTVTLVSISQNAWWVSCKFLLKNECCFTVEMFFFVFIPRAQHLSGHCFSYTSIQLEIDASIMHSFWEVLLVEQSLSDTNILTCPRNALVKQQMGNPPNMYILYSSQGLSYITSVVHTFLYSYTDHVYLYTPSYTYRAFGKYSDPLTFYTFCYVLF
jgi:hypothetical protein